jgi:hypothetical protein
MPGLMIRRNDGETWRECAARYGRKHGLEAEIIEMFDADVAELDTPHSEDDEGQIALDCCMEWDVCDVDNN